MLRKTRSPTSAERGPDRNGSPQQAIKSLTSERNALRRRVAQLRRENRVLKESLGKLLFDDIKINKRELLKQAVFEPSILEVVDQVVNVTE